MTAAGAAHPSSRWTQEERDAIATMMRNGLSATQIGDEFGVSRRTIIGLAYRDKQLKQIGFAGSRGRTGRRGPQKPRKPATVSVSRKGKVTSNPAWRMQRKAKLRVVKPAIDRTVFGAPHVAGIRLADFNSHRCKWCINDPEQGANEHLFCGETTNDGPYCAYHSTLAYRPVGKVDERGTDQRQAA